VKGSDDICLNETAQNFARNGEELHTGAQMMQKQHLGSQEDNLNPK
jgi:hypothetical protein